jgi:murein L,D-transpeptidase YcbB/YkuD
MRAANDYRWLNAVRSKQRIVLVNIPSAQLKVYEGPKTTLQMKIILGKASTPTKTLSTYIQQVTINPYWTVPKSIIVNEMIPKIQKDIQYLSNNRLAVLNENYKVMDPQKINWDSIDLVNFPYIIRQATGCENALGILKLEFENPFSMYLHDTPEKQLFKNKNRFLSHGCMRMEKPIEMGRLLLANNLKAIDTLDLTKCDLNLQPIFIPVTIRTPLIVWYSQVDFDSNNNLLFYKNVYNR